MCRKHYLRWSRHGEVKGRYRQPSEDRFWPKVRKLGPDECWPWIGDNGEGYGTFYRHPKDGGRIGAHRFSYELHCEPIPPGLLVMHSCDNPRCVNPAHLSVGTPKENMADMDAKGRRRAGAARGERSALAILNEHAVRFIRASEMNNSQLARIFNVTPNAIRAVRLGKSWDHIT